jgi:hypothetical protein
MHIKYNYSLFIILQISSETRNVGFEVIATKVWNELGSRDIRDVIKVARLATNAEDIPFVISMLKGQNKQSC